MLPSPADRPNDTTAMMTNPSGPGRPAPQCWGVRGRTSQLNQGPPSPLQVPGRRLVRPLPSPHRLRQAPEAGHQGKPDHPRRPLAPLSPVGSVPENGPAGGARTRLVVPGVLRVRAVGSAWRLGRNLVGVQERRLRGSSGWRTVRRRRPSGLRHSGSRFGFRRGRISHVVPQGRPDDLQAPLRTRPLGELRPRQHLVYPRDVFLGDGNPEHDGDAAVSGSLERAMRSKYPEQPGWNASVCASSQQK